MTQDDARLLSVAHAISERLPVDWAEAESSASATDPTLRDTVRELRIIAEIAALHRAAEPAPQSDRWGPLKLVEHVGHGSYGDVYRAIDTRLEREVALKLLRRPESSSDALGSAAIDEARLLARVRHPNVVTIHGADRIDGHVGLWMEFVRGRTLEQLVRERGPFLASDVAGIAVDVCRALAAVHDAGLLHRDIKAQNVMREDGGRLVLMDFGAGREAIRDEQRDLAGTPLYLAPEVLEGQAATVQSDLYSVGVLLFHVATGEYPVTGGTLAEIRASHARRRAPDVGALRADLPPALVSLINSALDPLPAQRFVSAAEMEAAALAVASNQQSRRKPAARWAAIASLGVILTAGAATVGWLRRDVLPPPRGDRAVWKGKDVDLFGTVSDDGRYLTFIDWNVRDNLMLRDLERGTSRPLTRNTVLNEFGTAEYSVMSPDGRRVAYEWVPRDSPRQELRLMDIVNGGPGPERVLWNGEGQGIRPLAWSPDERSLLVQVVRRQANERDIASLDISSGRTRVIKTLPGYLRTDHVVLSPDGRFVAYDLSEVGKPQDIFVVRSDGLRESRVVAGTSSNVVMGWSRSGHLLFASDRSGTLGLWALALHDGVPSGAPIQVKNDIGSSWSLGLTSSDTLYVPKQSAALSLRVAPFDGNQGAIDESAPEFFQHFIESRGRHDWSADGKFLAFIDCGRTGGGVCSIWIRTVATGEVRKVPHRMEYVWYPRLSPNGRYIVTAGNVPREGPGVYSIDTRTGATSLIVAGAARQQFALDWSADGTRIHYLRDGDGMVRLIEREVASGHERELFRTTLPGVREVRLSPDGRIVAFVMHPSDRGDSTLMLASLQGGEPRKVMSGPDFLDWRIEWTPDSRAMLVRKGPNGEFWLVPVDGLARKLNINTTRWNGNAYPQFDPTGRYLSYVATAGEPGGEVWALENFLPRQSVK